jgi:hypothetical protein
MQYDEKRQANMFISLSLSPPTSTFLLDFIKSGYFKEIKDVTEIIEQVEPPDTLNWCELTFSSKA